MEYCNVTQIEDLIFKCLPQTEQVIFFAFCVLLILSLLLNILCCVLKCCPGRVRGRLNKKQRLSSRKMEENPIYGNLNYTSTGEALYTEEAPLHPSVGSSSLRKPQRVRPDSQDCYANLTLKAPKPKSSRSSPQIQAEAAPVEGPAESEGGAEGRTDGVSTVSELYSSVQTRKTKTIDSTDTAEEYANHLREKDPSMFW